MKQNKTLIILAIMIAVFALFTSCESPSATEDYRDILPPDTNLIMDIGQVKYITLEGGFWGIVGAKANYEPINLPAAYCIDGLWVSFTAQYLPDMVSIHMWGKIIRITKIAKIPAPITFVLSQEFKLPVKQSAYSLENKIILTFDSVLTDSRCPIGVQCIWQGEATIQVNITVNGKDYGKYNLSTLAPANVVVVDKYKFTLTNLYPYPVYGSPIDPSKYIASIIVDSAVSITP